MEATNGGKWRHAVKLKELFQRSQPARFPRTVEKAKGLSPIASVFTPVRVEQRVPFIAMYMAHRWAQVANLSVTKGS